jgi:hypothetical protein
MTGQADDLSVISCHERLLHSITSHRFPATAYGSSGSLFASHPPTQPGTGDKLPLSTALLRSTREKGPK